MYIIRKGTDINIRLEEENTIWEEVIDYLADNFKLQPSTVKRQIKKYWGNEYMFYPISPDIFIDMRAKQFIDSLDLSIDNISWHRIIDSDDDIDYCRYYDRQFFVNTEFDVPDYYDIETDSWIWEQIERDIPDGFWLESGDGSGSDLFVCHEYVPDMFIDSMEYNGDYTTDRLYIQQICNE